MKKKEWFPFFKQNKRKHDSGYRCFDVGYVMAEENKVIDEVIIGTYTDHIGLNDEVKCNIDIMDDGKIRIHSKKWVKWSRSIGGSSMYIEQGLEDSIEKLKK